MSPTHYFKRHQTLQTLTVNFEKTVRPATCFQKQQLQSVSIFFKFCPSVPPFVFTVLFVASFNLLRAHFYASLNLGAVATFYVSINFVAQLL